MQKIGLIFIFVMMVQAETIFDFDTNSNIANWVIVDDVVMGGRSSGNFSINQDGNGVFKGNVSIENNGGFSSLRYRKKMKTVPYTKVVLRVKGDGKAYQFRIKTKTLDYYSYIGPFTTTNDWETIEITLSDMYPAARGRKLNFPNYTNEGIEEIAFLIGNKKTEDFILIIDSISLR
ncbi:CIA30 family protein [bacterium]|nr:CIA30 family protein [bacterium]